jgi:solute:Na+ symporter, SSS family
MGRVAPKGNDSVRAPNPLNTRVLQYDVLVVAALVLGTGCADRPVPTDASTQRQQLLLVLQREMDSNTGWVRVHAADALIDHHHAQPVAPSFTREADTAAPPYRIGVWRVLARAAATEEQRQAFIERIRRTMLDPQAPDRVHAAESLGKLGAASSSDNPALLEWLATASEPASVYPLWLLVLAGSSGVQASSEEHLCDLLDSQDSTARLRAAFTLGCIKVVSPASIARLNRRLELEAEDSPVRTYVAAALLRHTARDSSGAAQLKRQLANSLMRGQPAEQLEAAITLGMCGITEELPVFSQLLHSPEADARIGAASGSLYILEAGNSLINR